jgi:hypothetical protein
MSSQNTVMSTNKIESNGIMKLPVIPTIIANSYGVGTIVSKEAAMTGIVNVLKDGGELHHVSVRSKPYHDFLIAVGKNGHKYAVGLYPKDLTQNLDIVFKAEDPKRLNNSNDNLFMALFQGYDTALIKDKINVKPMNGDQEQKLAKKLIETANKYSTYFPALSDCSVFAREILDVTKKTLNL